MSNVRLQVGQTSVHDGPCAGSFLYVTGMAVDADGAPRAYHPDNIGLDYLANAGHSGHWWGVVTDTGQQDGTPIVQGPCDPAPGYYISATSLCDRQRPSHDPRRYVDSATIPFVVFPPEVTRNLGPRLGDLCAVLHRPSGKLACAVFADGGPAGHLGEGSIALADALGIPSSPRHGGTSQADVAYLVFPGSRGSWPMTAEAIAAAGAKLLDGAGGVAALQAAVDALGESRALDLDWARLPGSFVRPTLQELFGDAVP